MYKIALIINNKFNNKLLGEISQHVFVTLPLNLKKVLLKIPFKNTILELNVALGRNIIVVIKEMDDWEKTTKNKYSL